MRTWSRSAPKFLIVVIPSLLLLLAVHWRDPGHLHRLLGGCGLPRGRRLRVWRFCDCRLSAAVRIHRNYEGIVIGDILRRDGAAQYAIGPTESPGLLDDVAVTRLSRHTGQDGSGKIAYLFFTALKDTGAGSTSAKISHALLVDRNALAIDKTYINYGNCRAAIDDDAPPLVQPPVGARVYLPVVLRSMP